MLNSAGSAAMESLTDYADNIVCQQALSKGLALTPRISLGYGDLILQEQHVGVLTNSQIPPYNSIEMAKRGFSPDCKLPPQLRDKVLNTNPSHRRYGTCTWASMFSETKTYCANCPRVTTIGKHI